ncbi:hypothetical protein THAOC_05364 [Thalassiosira oceanica]|uniref:Uncharacterized protein n=1 Tax=Thalassiosira oceanica TaxID=159749 RepID=K0T7D9_THAOC|nr:hypothetical protein THAOC_05364 [Thalassiosira oceanica]|eukprot:EJK73039.1 hypothetical protein THAOC_05364 [Thalassiosira oceanica]
MKLLICFLTDDSPAGKLWGLDWGCSACSRRLWIKRVAGLNYKLGGMNVDWQEESSSSSAVGSGSVLGRAACS